MELKGTAELPLHWGKAPEWLYERMVKLSGQVIKIIADDYGREEVLKRLSDPYWFQAFGSVLGFDWHSSGLTTVTMAAVKEALAKVDVGIKVAGGKGASKTTPNELLRISDELSVDGERLVRYSRLAAKVDGVAVQDGYTIYQHWVVVSEDGIWAVVQQGMNAESGYARRYHIMGDMKKDMLNDPHSGIAALDPGRSVLNLATSESEGNRKATLEMLNMPRGIESWIYGAPAIRLEKYFDKRLIKVISSVTPLTYEELLLTPGLGAQGVRALALTAAVIYGESPSWKDPAVYSFAHGGKDGIPYPVNREAYDRTIEFLREVIEGLDVDVNNKKEMLRRLASNSWLKAAGLSLK